MQTYKVETTLAQDGTLVLQGLPFHAGERVEVIVQLPLQVEPERLEQWPGKDLEIPESLRPFFDAVGQIELDEEAIEALRRNSKL